MSTETDELNETGRPALKLAIVAPTPFYYQVPLFKALAKHPRIESEVYYCSKESITARDVVKQYRTRSPWGIEDDLLTGYSYKFLRNYSPVGSYLKSFVGLVNLGVLKMVWQSKPDVVILMSWMNPTWWLAVFACLISRTPFVYLTDQNIQGEPSPKSLKGRIKGLALGKLLFRWSSGFLIAGAANRKMYESYGVPAEKLVPFAFAWGYDSLLQSSKEIAPERARIRTELGIPDDSFVILYCGRMSPEKGLMSLLKAYDKVKIPGKVLAFVGGGKLQPMLNNYAIDHGIESVCFFGFQNRKEISKFYTISDVLVLPSYREPWGMVVSESLCFGLPVVTSDQVGASLDMVREGHNGFTFPVGDVDALTDILQRLADLPEHTRLRMGKNSRQIMERWANRDLVGLLDQQLDRLSSGKRASARHKSS